MEKFNTVFRGYDKNEVHKCLDEIIKSYEGLLNKSKKTEADNKLLLEKLSYYEKKEETLNRALFVAENASDEIKSSARRECESMINEAINTINDLLV